VTLVPIIERLRSVLAAFDLLFGADIDTLPTLEECSLVFQCHGEEAGIVARRLMVSGIPVSVEKRLLPTPPGIGALGILYSVSVPTHFAGAARDVVAQRKSSQLGWPPRSLRKNDRSLTRDQNLATQMKPDRSR
jgi:hypothetical protein